MDIKIRIISDSNLFDFEEKCNLFLCRLPKETIIDTQLVISIGGFYLKISYYG